MANIVLHELDRVWEERCGHLGTLVRYADDFVVVCRSETAATESRRRLGLILDRLRLDLHPAKTRLVDLRRGAGGFDFLGFHHRMGESWRWRGHWYLYKWPSPQTMKAIRRKVKQALAPRQLLPRSLGDRVRAINLVLRGWGQYFGIGNAAQHFAAVDTYVYWRFVLFDRAKHQRRSRHAPGLGLALAAAGLYRLSGTVRYRATVHAPR